MKLIKEYALISFILIIIVSFLFIKLIDGSYIFTSGDTLSPTAIKNAILNYSYKYYPLYLPNWVLLHQQGNNTC